MQSSWLPCASVLINVNKGKWGEWGGKDEVSFFISILKSQFTSRASSLLIRYIKNGLRRDPGALDVVEADKNGSLGDTANLILEENHFLSQLGLSRGTVQPFSSIRFHPWLAWYLRDIWSLTGVTDSKYMQIHVIASSYRNSKEICPEAQANLPAHTLVITNTCTHSEADANVQVSISKLKHMGKQAQTQILRHIWICSDTNMQVQEQKYGKKSNTKAQRHANTHWAIFTNDQLTWPSPIPADSSPIPLNEGIIGQSSNLSHIHANMHLR